MKKILYVLLIIIIAGAVWFWVAKDNDDSGMSGNTPDKSALAGHEQAELTGFGFMNDFVKIAPPNPDKDAEARIYESLSSSARKRVSKNTLSRDLASFVGVQDVPDQGVSVENLIINEDGSATLLLGLNYSGSSRVLRNINLIVEGGEWKVDGVSVPVESE